MPPLRPPRSFLCFRSTRHNLIRLQRCSTSSPHLLTRLIPSSRPPFMHMPLHPSRHGSARTKITAFIFLCERFELFHRGRFLIQKFYSTRCISAFLPCFRFTHLYHYYAFSACCEQSPDPWNFQFQGHTFAKKMHNSRRLLRSSFIPPPDCLTVRL